MFALIISFFGRNWKISKVVFLENVENIIEHDQQKTFLRIFSELADCGYEGTVLRATDMQDAVSKAASLAKTGDSVLLSPAAASFDMFRNFEVRGNVFKECVNAL